MKEKVIFAALVAAFFVVFNMVAENPFVMDPRDPDAGIGMWGVALILILIMSYAPLVKIYYGNILNIIANGIGFVISIQFGGGALLMSVLFALVVSLLVIGSEDLQKMLMRPFDDNEK